MNEYLSDQNTKSVYAILARELGVKLEALTPEARILDDLGADSLTVVEIGIALEEQFNISIPDEQLGNVSTVEDVFEMLAKHLGKR